MNNNLPSFGLIPVRVTLELIDSQHNGATAIARSALIDGKRVIRVGLCQDHLLVSRALQRADVLTVRFLIALSLVEFTQFWSSSRDGTSLNRELRKLSGFAPSENAFESSYASRLSISEAMRAVDTLPIFGREPQTGPFTLFEFEVAQRTPSDITNWARNGPAEKPKPIPPKPSKQKPVPLPAEPPMLAEPPVDPFLRSFYARARELLDGETFAALETLCREEKS